MNSKTVPIKATPCSVSTHYFFFFLMMLNQVEQTELAIKVTTRKTLPARFILSMLDDILHWAKEMIQSSNF